MGLNSKEALDAVMRPLPPADDMLEAVAMRIVRYGALLPPGVEPWQRSFHDLSPSAQIDALAVAEEVLDMLRGAQAATAHDIPAPTALPTTPIRLDDIDGTPRFVGTLMTITPGPAPTAVRHDGQIYVATGNVVGSGSTPTRHIYRRSTPAVVASVSPAHSRAEVVT
jgi:hypothetical protein